LAEIYRHRGKHAEAAESLRRALAAVEKLADEVGRHPLEGELYYRLALVVATTPPTATSSKEAQLRKASELFAQALRISPGHLQARFAWATVLRDLGDLEAAETQYVQTYKQSANSTEYLGGVVSIYQMQVDKLSRLRRWTEALPYAKKLAGLLPDDEGFARQVREIEQKAQ
jgi:tetratricopeptide (TPR) repeat protein